MNKFERQSRNPADEQTLPETIAGDLSQIPAAVINDPRPIAPKARLTAGDIRSSLTPRIPGRFQPLMGDYRLSSGVDRGGAGVRHAERHLWPPRHDHRRPRPV